MKLSGIIVIAAVGLAAVASHAEARPAPDPGYSYYEIGNTKTERPGRPEQALLLVGGGSWDNDAFRWFAEKTGHGHLVVLAASGADEDNEAFYREIGGFASVQTIVFTDGKASYDRRVLDVLGKADGIFLAGGDQSKYVRFWKGTPVARAIDQKIASGHPVGGTSAGLAILGAEGYGAMDGGSIDSPAALADPLGPAVTIVRDFLHMPFLGHVVTDTHFMARERLGRLVAFLAQVRTRWDPNAIGLGVDEGSALCVDSNGVGRFFTSKNGLAWLVEPAGMPGSSNGKPLDWKSIQIRRFGPGASIDLKTMQVTNGLPPIIISVDHGRLNGI